MRVRESHILVMILFLSMAGIAIATYLVADHYQVVESVCLYGEDECGSINRGPYSTIFGVPWSVIGLVGFVIVFVLAYLRLYYAQLDSNYRFIPMILLVSIVGVIFVIYLNYLELFEIHAICSWCTISHIFMIVILLLIAWWFFLGRFRDIEAAK